MTKAKVTDFIPDDKNANRGTERCSWMLEESLRKHGAGRSILVDKDGRIIAGNKTAEKAHEIGLDDAIVVETDGQQLVVVKRTDLDLDSDEARMLAYRDNRSGQVGLDWDAEQIVADLAAGLQLDEIWRADELELLLLDVDGNGSEPAPDPGAQIDRAQELQEKWQVERGQVWLVPSKSVEGKCHRVMCGDSTDEEDVGRLMGGEKPNLMVTDPPYGVEYDPMFRERALGAADRRTQGGPNDDRASWSATFGLFPGDVAYVWHADKQAIVSGLDLESCGFEIRATIIWNKSHCPFGQGHYHYRHEPCWYSVRKSAKAHWAGKSDQTVWDIRLDETVEGGHSTQKPLECMARPIRNHEGDVYDPFLGSGTTIVACEQLGRIGYGMEIEPKYVAVTLERLSQMGLEPELG